MSQPKPSFFDSPYFVMEVDNWHLKEDAPEELKEEFEAYMNVSNGMTKDEFIIKAKQLGYSDSTITNIIKFNDQARERGINIPLHIDLIELPLKINFQKFNIK